MNKDEKDENSYPFEVPIKKEYVVMKQKVIEKMPTVSCNDDDDNDKDKNSKAKTLGGYQKRTMKMKKQMMRENSNKREREQMMCFQFLKNERCEKERCTFSHDLGKYLENKEEDLPGVCLFANAKKCPFGIACRFYRTHETKKDSVQREDGCVVLFEEPLKNAREGDLNDDMSEVKYSLAKGKYDFSRADAVLKAMGLKTSVYDEKKKNMKREHNDDDEKNKKNNKEKNKGESHQRIKRYHHQQQQQQQQQKIENADEYSDDDIDEMLAIKNINRETNETAPTKIAKDDEMITIHNNGKFDVGNNDDKDYENITMSVEQLLKPKEKKTIDFKKKLYLAPLTTVGNLPFRRLCKTLGADITCGEMALATSLLKGDAREWALVKRHKSEDVFGVQICGGHSDSLARCVQALDDSIECDFIDINMGCPIDLICNKGAGSMLLEKPRRMEELVRSANIISSVPVTFKTRMGYKDTSRVAHTIAPLIKEWGAAALTLHGRTRAQRYSREADWSYIKKVADVSPVPLIGNGDIYTYEDFKNNVTNNESIATCMIARGALVKPWVFTEIKEQRNWDISSSERFDQFKDFAKFGLEHWGSDSRGVEQTRRFLLEWMSFTHRYVPVGLLETTIDGKIPNVSMTQRPPKFVGRDDMETMLASDDASVWVDLCEKLLGKAPADWKFVPKHKSNAYKSSEGGMAFDEAQG